MAFQPLLDAGLPFLAALLGLGLQQAHYSDKANTLIASIAVLAAGGVSVWASGQITPDVLKDSALIMTVATALQSTAFAPLQHYLRDNFLSGSSRRPSVRATVKDWNGDKSERGE